jgi:hypothetical protein
MLSAKISKMRHVQLLVVFLVPMVALIMGAAAPQAWATGWWGSAEEWDETVCGLEGNLTDNDFGFYSVVDSEGVRWYQIYTTDENHRNKKLQYSALTSNGLALLGVAEDRFESREPVGSKDLIEELFPPGWCKYVGKTYEGNPIKGRAPLSNDFACGVEDVLFTSNGTVLTEDDLKDPKKCVPVGEDLTVSWNAVDTMLVAVAGPPENFSCSGELGDEEIEGYQFFVEADNQELRYDIEADDGTIEVVVPASFLEGIEYDPEDEESEKPKFEINVLFKSNLSIREFEFTPCNNDE